MGTLRKTWHLRDEDILYVEENHDGKYGAPGKKRQPKRKLTPEDIYRINHWNKIKKAKSGEACTYARTTKRMSIL